MFSTEPTVSLVPLIYVNEGEIAQVCIEITNANLLNPDNPPTVMLATVESDSKTVIYIVLAYVWSPLGARF